uniref:Fibronectin type-III domain-containing protein n=1 Tax=Podarcis muralis TaxID=64176 RepID=A0A670HZS0_PODMU
MGRQPFLLFLFWLGTSWEAHVPHRVIPSNATVFSHIYTIKLKGDGTEDEGASSAPQEALGPPGSSRGGGLYEHTLEGPDQEHVVFTHRINLPQQSCGCPPGTEDTQDLLRRLAGGGCCPATSSSQASTGKALERACSTEVTPLRHKENLPHWVRVGMKCGVGENPVCHYSFFKGRRLRSLGSGGQTDTRTLCSNHGSFDLSRCLCECEAGWSGATCAEPTCPGGCGGPQRGKCANGRCQCRPRLLRCPLRGAAFLPRRLQRPRALCGRALRLLPWLLWTFLCRPGLPAGLPRSWPMCGWAVRVRPRLLGPDCGSRACPSNCNRRGECHNGRCICEPGFMGPRGRCLKGAVCACHKGYTGPDCGQLACPEDCSGRGECQNGVCLCHDGYSGEDCFERRGLMPGEEYTVTVRAEKGQRYGPPSPRPCVHVCSLEQCVSLLTLNWEPPRVAGETQPAEWGINKLLLLFSLLPVFYSTPPPSSSHRRPDSSSSGPRAGQPGNRPQPGRSPSNVAKAKELFMKKMTENISTKLSPYNGTLLERLESYLREPAVVGSSSGSIEVSLDSVRGVSDNVVILYRNTGTGEVGELVVPGDSSRAVITGLDPGTTYHVEIHGVLKGRSSKSYSFITATGSPSAAKTQTFPRLTTKSPEVPLRDLTVTDISPDSLRVTWSAPPSSFRSFSLQYRDPKSSAPPGEIRVPGTERSVTVMGLTPRTEYELELSGEKPDGSYNPPLTTKTSTGTSLWKPTLGQLSVSDIKENSARLSWDIPTGTFDSFLIQYKDAEGKPKSLPVDGGSQEVTIYDLAPSRKYKFSLYGLVGRKRHADATTAPLPTTPAPQPSLGELSVSDVTTDSVRLSWTVPTGSFDSFLVQYKDAEGKPQALPVDGGSREVTISSLVPSRRYKYKFNLYGLTGRKRLGPISTDATTASSQEHPTPPSLGELSASDATSDSIRLSWTVPTGNFDSFLIQYKDAEGKPQAIPVEGPFRETIVPNLVPSRRYKFNLYGLTGRKRHGPISTDATTGQQRMKWSTGLWSLPSPCRGQAFVLSSSGDSARLSWTVPTGNFDSFLVEYEDADGRPLALPVDGASRTLTVPNLEPSHRYTFNLYGLYRGKRYGPLPVEAVTGQQRMNWPTGLWSFTSPRANFCPFFLRAHLQHWK